MPRLEQWEIKKYWEIFRGLKPEKNKLNGDKLKPVFNNSHLAQDQLTKIWDLADIDVDGELDFEEFCIAMRLIFDLVNGNTTKVPYKLPDWLIPGSKRHLVEADQAVVSNVNNTGNSSGGESDTDDEYTLSSDFDWYISPTDKNSYEDVYNSSCDNYGRISFNSLDGLYKTLSKVPPTDISYAWNIVNPKQSETIDKDQCLVFLHILNQRSNGKRVPRSIPPSLRATFSKEVPEYDIDSHQGDLKLSSNSPAQTQDNEPKSFASSYVNKLGSSNNELVSNGTDFTGTEGTDWEEVKLRRELEDLEKLLKRAEFEKNNKSKDSKTSLLKYEFEQLLKYKEEQVKQMKSNIGGASDLNSVLSNIGSIEVHVNQLETFLQSKKDEFSQLNKQIESLK
ncbi:endocytosis defective- protein [Pichia californica]|uniref:Actin cytoskeleton-regulatory complex protein END3 n=1 Tax=Pichia californica TaxID=460514 RepID=A0A9P6WHU9_9ASCO|nr:endocytosis defective- protein [[Candida] californica]KAG0687474.1 endocytosis defective- protein [[Candida] californica]